eukprot:ANDGO_00047.mRNA.1 Ctype lysozyme/alpha-lactalbumin superfamily protein
MRVLLAVTLLAVLATSAFAQNSCGSGNPCGGGSNPYDIPTACSMYNGWSQDCCECIAQNESGGNLSACNLNNNNTYDVGFWQINSSNWNACSGGNAPCDINSNLQCAIDIWNWGSQTWQYWSTCSGCGCCNSS